MGRRATTRQQAPVPATQNVELKQPTFTENDLRLRAYEIYLKRSSNPASALSKSDPVVFS